MNFYVILDAKRILDAGRIVCLTNLFPKFANAGKGSWLCVVRVLLEYTRWRGMVAHWERAAVSLLGDLL